MAKVTRRTGTSGRRGAPRTAGRPRVAGRSGTAGTSKSAGALRTPKAARRPKKAKTASVSKPQGIKKTSKTNNTGSRKSGRTNLISFVGNRRQKKAMTRAERLWLRCVLAAVGIIYFGAAAFFHFHFLPNSYINGVEVSLDTVSGAEEKMSSHTKEYELVVKGVEGTSDEIITGENLNVQFTQFSEVKDALKRQHEFLWPFILLPKKSQEINLNVKYNADALEDAMSRLNILNPEKFKAVADAYVATDERGYYTVYPEVLGSEIRTDEAKDAIRAAVGKGLADVDLEEFRIYPNIYSDDPNLLHREEQWNEYMKSEGMTYVLWNKDEMIFTPEVIGSLLTDNGTDISLNEQAVEDLVMSWHLNYDTYDVPWNFTTHYGDTVEITTGDYGWRMYVDDTTASVKSNLYAHTAGRFDVDYVYKGIYDYNQGLGDTYVEVCLGQQMMWIYNGGECVVETPVVTGTAGNESRMTHTGCYSIKDKDTHVTLGTYEANGYETPVNYWVPFNGGEGIHDASWRGDFGGDIWLSSGSHGCVNTPPDVMPIVYDNVFEDHPVVVYN